MSSAASTVEDDVGSLRIFGGWTKESNAEADLMIISSDNYALWVESKQLVRYS